MMTDFVQAQSPCMYRLALLDPGAATILTVRTDGELGLPQVAVPRTVRTVEFIQRSIAERWGAAAVVLDLPDPGEDGARWVLAELRSSPTSLASTMLSLKEIPDGVISARERTVLRNLLSAPSLGHSSDPLHPLNPLHPLTCPGWIDEARRWIEDAIGGGAALLKDEVRQLNAGGGFALARFETRSGRGYWLKATGAPNIHEFAITTALAETLPEFLPSLVVARPDWNAWVMEEAGPSLWEAAAPSTLEQAATTLAEFGVRSLTVIDQMRKTGCGSRSIGTLLDRLGEILAWLEEAMSCQTSTKALQLGPDQIQELGSFLREACLRMMDLGIPDGLVHGDMNPGNILSKGGRTVFIDWAETYVGNPLLAFEGFAAHLKRAGALFDSAVPRLGELYRERWEVVVPASRLDAAFELTPPLAIAMTLYGRGDWLHSPRRHDPAFQAYARSLARRIYQICREIRAEALCQ